MDYDLSHLMNVSELEDWYVQQPRLPELGRLVNKVTKKYEEVVTINTMVQMCADMPAPKGFRKPTREDIFRALEAGELVGVRTGNTPYVFAADQAHLSNMIGFTNPKAREEVAERYRNKVQRRMLELTTDLPEVKFEDEDE